MAHRNRGLPNLIACWFSMANCECHNQMVSHQNLPTSWSRHPEPGHGIPGHAKGLGDALGQGRKFLQQQISHRGIQQEHQRQCQSASIVNFLALWSINPMVQWPWLRNRLIGGTDSIYKAYFSGLCFREYPHKIWPYMVLTYLHFRILKFPLIQGKKKCQKETLKKLEGAFGWFSDKKNAPPHGFL